MGSLAQARAPDRVKISRHATEILRFMIDSFNGKGFTATSEAGSLEGSRRSSRRYYEKNAAPQNEELNADSADDADKRRSEIDFGLICANLRHLRHLRSLFSLPCL